MENIWLWCMVCLEEAAIRKAIIRRYAGEILKSTHSHPLPLFSSNADSELDALYDKMNHVTLDDVLNGNEMTFFNLFGFFYLYTTILG